jgi:transposase
MIKRPPMHERTGTRRWTPGGAKRLVGLQVHKPKTVQEKVEAVHDLTADDQVVAVVTTDFLRRPEVASLAMTDRDIASDLLFRLRLVCPHVVQVYADSAHSGELVGWDKRFLGMTINVVSRPPGATGFVLLPRRWVVERTLSWLLRARCNVLDYERLPQHSEAALTWSA